MRLLALCLSGWIVGVCGCIPRAQQIVSGYGSGQEISPQKTSEKGRTTGRIVQVAHFDQDHGNDLPYASETARAQALKRLTGLKVTPEPSFAGLYRALTAAQCRCRAAQASGMGNLLEQEAGLASSHGRKGDMKQALLSNSAQEARNKDAAAALEMFYRLAEAEARWALLAASIDQVQKAIAHGDKLKKQGLPVPTDLDQFSKQDFDLKSDRVRLAVGIEKLNRNLARKVKIEGVPEQERLWPVADFTVPEEPIDVAAAVELGLAQRPELVFLRQANQDASVANLAELRKALSASNALLGSTGGPCMKVIAILCKDETGNRRQQIQQLQEQREREIGDEIREAAADMNGQVLLIALASARSTYAASKLKEQEDKLAKGTGSVFEVASARLTWLKARDQQVREVIAWHLAHTRLQEAQGILAQDCDPKADLLPSAPPRLSPPQEFPPMETRVIQYRRTYSEGF
jgi:hypothetical protein